MQTQPTVVVVEDDNEVLDFVACTVAALPVVVQRFSCAHETLDFYKPDMPGCFVIGQHIRDIPGLHLRRKLAAQGCQQPFIFISRHGDVSSAVEAMHQGALDCISKPFDRQRLLDGVQKAIARDSVARRLRAERAIVIDRIRQFTPREAQILKMVAAGKLTKEIARHLSISHKTVEVHRSNLMRKMRVDSAAALLHLIALHDLCPLADPANGAKYPSSDADVHALTSYSAQVEA